MSGNFADHKAIPFAMGSLTGLRSFVVALDPSTSRIRGLNGMHYTHHYTSGENAAYCYNNMQDGVTIKIGADWVTGHHLAVDWCQCGFYAYYDGQNRYSSRMSITGIVQGYGKCSYGKNGFRAEKLKILALINPYLSDEQVAAQAAKDNPPVETEEEVEARTWITTKKALGDRWANYCVSRWAFVPPYLLCLVYIAQMFFFSLLVTNPVYVVVNTMGMLLVGLSAAFLSIRIKKYRLTKTAFLVVNAQNEDVSLHGKKTQFEQGMVSSSLSSSVFEELSKRYPNVPQYRTVLEATKMFPLTDYYKDTPGGRERAKSKRVRDESNM